MSSPSSPTVSTSLRVTGVLPKASKQALQILLELAAEKHTIDASTTLALTGLLSDREFAIEFKKALTKANHDDKVQRAINKEAKLQKQADKLGIDLDTHKANIQKLKDETASSGSSVHSSPKKEENPLSTPYHTPVVSTASSPLATPVESPKAPPVPVSKEEKPKKEGRKKKETPEEKAARKAKKSSSNN